MIKINSNDKSTERERERGEENEKCPPAISIRREASDERMQRRAIRHAFHAIVIDHHRNSLHIEIHSREFLFVHLSIFNSAFLKCNTIVKT